MTPEFSGETERAPIDAEELRGRIDSVRSAIRAASIRSGRSPDEVLLVAVTKTVPVEVVGAARREGIRDFAENYANELAVKAPHVDATWHYVGKIQRGTAHRVADHAGVVHSAEPGPALERLGRRAASAGKEIQALLQVDFSGRRQGVAPEDVAGAVEVCASVEGIALVGLMTLPPWNDDPEATRPFFARLRELIDDVRRTHAGVIELSMGMSGDYEVAVEEGATMVRIGTALFGPRNTPDLPGDASPGEER